MLALGVSFAAGQTLNVSTLAGSARTVGEVNGPDANALFSGPYGITVAASGALYVVDHGSGALREISGGQVTTLSAHFYSPYGIVADASGNLYVTDTLNYVVDKVATDGTVSVLAGQTGSSGTTDGAGAAAQFTGPTGIAIDGSGNLYVADTNRSSGGAVLREITPDGAVSTVASGFVDLRGVAVGSDGTIYVSDVGDNSIRTVASNGTVSLFAGMPGHTGSNDGSATTARFNYPSALAFDGGGNLYVADFGNSVIRQISPAGNVVTVAGLATIEGSTDGSGSTARFYTPNGIAIDGQGNVYIADTGNDTIRLATGATPQSAASPSSTGGSASSSAGGGNLVNLSVRAMVGAGNQNLVVGFVSSGSAPANLLIRGVGPALAQFGVSDPLSNPELTLYSSSGASIASNEGWGDSATLAQEMSSVGAFALPANSPDAAMSESLTPGIYTAQVTGAQGSSGVALAEIYDEDGANSATHLINVSSRAEVGGDGQSSLVAGFVIGGTGSEQVLIRGVGPALSAFGVSDALATPQLTVFNSSGGVIVTQTGWANNAAVAQVSSQVGAFALPANSADCAVVLTLPTGTYSAQVTGLNNTAGSALIEVYAVQ